MATLDEFESRLQSLLEVHLLKHLPGYKVEDGIAQQLAAAMHGHLKEDSGGSQAPNLLRDRRPSFHADPLACQAAPAQRTG